MSDKERIRKIAEKLDQMREEGKEDTLEYNDLSDDYHLLVMNEIQAQDWDPD